MKDDEIKKWMQDPTRRERHITTYMHCPLCVQEKPDEEAMATWARLNFGWTKEGLQVWCMRHDSNLFHLHFMGRQVLMAEGPPILATMN